jgi:putative RecB family exonuclease
VAETLTEPLSYSRISTYNECAKKFELKYIQKLETPPHWYFSYGKSIHAVLEKLLSCHMGKDGQLYSNDMALFPTSLAQLLDEAWLTDGYTDQADQEKRRREALRVLTAFFPVFQSTWPQMLYAEHLINIELDGIPFTGIIDRIDRVDDGLLRVIDYKSSKPREASTLTSHRFQVALYAAALGQQDEFREHRFILQTYYLRENLKAEMNEGSEACISRARQVLTKAASRILSGDFRAKRSRKCFVCDFRDVCPVFRSS